MELSYYVSRAIKKYLSDHDMKSYKLAEAAGCNKTALNNWLYQRQMPSAKGLIRLANYMNVSLDYMLGRGENKSIILSGRAENFARRLHTIMPDGLTSYRIAHDCGVGTSGVSKWKDMKRLPRLEVLVKLADMFECSVDYLVGRTNIYN